MNPAPSKSYKQRKPATVLLTTATATAAKATAVAGDRNKRNQLALKKLANLANAGIWRRQRDRIVRDNLPLVYAIAGRMSRCGSIPFEDLSQVGSLGLLRAIEAFQPSKGRNLSSFAVPYIRGAMQQEIRDRQSLMRIPRELWELRQRAATLQERSRQSKGMPLALGALARSLNCEEQKLQEAMNLNSIAEMRSLDAPIRQSPTVEDHFHSLLDELADPASLNSAEGDASGNAQPVEPWAEDPPVSPKTHWLRQRLAAMPQTERALIEGHLATDASWVVLAQELNLQPRQAQRRYQAVYSRLLLEAQVWSASAEGMS